MQKALFITIYGINNIGKTTHAKLLAERLKQEGFEAVYVKYPIYDLAPTGPKLNQVLRESDKQFISEQELQTIFMQNRSDFESTLKKMLAEGKIVIAEDYTGTGIAWGTAKSLEQSWVQNLNKDLLKEDVAILLVGERDIRAREQHHLHEQNDALVSSVNKIFMQLAEQLGWKIIHLHEKIEGTAEAIWDFVKKRLP